MTEVRQPAPGEIVVAQGDGGRFRVHFSGACPAAAASPDTTLLAREGWVCGRGGEYARVGETLCPIAAVERIDAAAYAASARQSLRTDGGTTVLDTVTVRGERRRGFAGSPNYCLNPRYMRGWSEDREGLRVEMAPRRAGGNRWYRVELASACPELAGSPSIRLHSGVGIGLVCGNAGDRVIVSAAAASGFAASGTSRTRSLGARSGCPIIAVYPIQDP